MPQLLESLNGVNGSTKKPVKPILGGDGKPIEKEGMLLPQYRSFASILNAASHTYAFRWDEAIKDGVGRQNALAMRRDCSIMEMMRERQLPTAQLPWSLVPEDEGNAEQVEVAEKLTKIVKRIPNFQRYRMSALEALWYGRYAVQAAVGKLKVGGEEVRTVLDHQPINGDKITFTWDGTPVVQINPGYQKEYPDEDRILNDGGTCLRLAKPFWRERLLIHKHEIDDADYYDGEMSGGIHGVGIRSRIYWCWWLRQECLSWTLDFIERAGQGMTIYYYELGNPEAKAQAERAVTENPRATAIAWPMPIGSEKRGNGVERLEAANSSGEILQSIIEYFDAMMRRYITGQTLSSQAEATGLGSGVADLHASTKEKIISFDSNNLDETITTDLVGPLQRWNFKGADFQVRFMSVLDKPNAGELLAGAKVAYEMGVEIDANQIRDLAGLSAPEEDAEIIGKSQQADEDLERQTQLAKATKPEDKAKFVREGERWDYMNPNHEPAGTPEGGRFASGGGQQQKDTSHLDALELRLSHERGYLSAAKNDKERKQRKVWIAQIEKEIASERAHLGIVEGQSDESDEDLLDDLMGTKPKETPRTRTTFTDEPDADPNAGSWQGNLFSPGGSNLLKQKPLFEGGTAKGGKEKKEKARKDQPTMFARDEGGGHWVTIDGAHVYIKGPRIEKGHPSVGTQKPLSHRQQMAEGKGDSRYKWGSKALKEGVKPGHLHQLAAEILGHDKAFKADHLKVLQQARQLSKDLGYGDIGNLKGQNARGKIDADSVRGLDDVAARMEAKYPELFHGHDAQEKLFEMLTGGNPENMTEEAAYEQALSHLVMAKAEEWVAARFKAEEEPVPFEKPDRLDRIERSLELLGDMMHGQAEPDWSNPEVAAATREYLAKLGKIQTPAGPVQFAREGFDPNEPRDAEGKWTDGPSVQESWKGGEKMAPRIAQAFGMIPEGAKKFGNVRVVMSPGGGSAYAMGQIYLDPEQLTGQWLDNHFYHEYAHHVSAKSGILATKEFSAAMEASKRRASKLTADDLEPKVETQGQAVGHENASQFLKALRGEQWGSDPEYIKDPATHAEEVFATAFQNYVHYNPKVWKHFPELYALLKKTFESEQGR